MNRAALLCLPLLLAAAAACTGTDPDASAEPVTSVTSAPGGSEPAAAYTVAPTGTQPDGEALERCLALPTVNWKQPFVAAPAVYRVTTGGTGYDEFQACMDGASGYAAVPTTDAVAAFIEQCAGGGKQYVVPSYIGLAEDEARRTKPADATPRIGSARVTARDGDCLPVTADFRPDRVDLIVLDGWVVWAALPDPTATGSTTGTAPAPAASTADGCGPFTPAIPGSSPSPPVCPADG